MPTTEPYDTTIRQGSTFRRTVRWQEPDGTPVNLTGYFARMQVRKRGELVLSLTSDTGSPEWSPSAHLTIDAETGTVGVYVGATRTAALTSGGEYDLELASASNPDEVEVLLRGTLTLEKEVTR